MTEDIPKTGPVWEALLPLMAEMESQGPLSLSVVAATLIALDDPETIERHAKAVVEARTNGLATMRVLRPSGNTAVLYFLFGPRNPDDGSLGEDVLCCTFSITGITPGIQ